MPPQKKKVAAKLKAKVAKQHVTISVSVRMPNRRRLEEWQGNYGSYIHTGEKKTLTQGDLVDLGLDLLAALGEHFNDGEEFGNVRRKLIARAKKAPK